MRPLRVGITRDFLSPDGDLRYDIGLALLEENPGITYDFVSLSPEAQPEEIKNYDVVMTTLSARFTARTFVGVENLAAIAKFGAGYNNIDTDACTENDVLVFTTPEGVIRPVAVAILTYILALSTRLFIKDDLVRTGRWQEKTNHMGMGLRGKVVGSIGLGNIAREFFRIAAPLDIVPLAHDPYISPEDAHTAGVRLIDLHTLLRESDFVCINCPLTPQTRHLIGQKELSLMKPTAYLVNTARGEVVDQAALTVALQERRIQGAALDVFDPEPLDPSDLLARLDNVILAPHGLAWTDELFRGNGEGCMRRILQIAQGQVPESVVNPEVLLRPGIQEKLARRRKENS